MCFGLMAGDTDCNPYALEIKSSSENTQFMQEGLGTRRPVQRHSCRRLPTQDVQQTLLPHHELCTSGLQRARYTVGGPQILSNYPASHHLLSMPNMKVPRSALRRVVACSSFRMKLQHIAPMLTITNNIKHTSSRNIRRLKRLQDPRFGCTFSETFIYSSRDIALYVVLRPITPQRQPK